VNPDAWLPVVLVLLCVAPLAPLGLALMNTGLGRAHSAAHALLSSLLALAAAALGLWSLGFAWSGLAHAPDHVVHLAGHAWSLLGAGQFFVRGSAAPVQLVALLWLLLIAGTGALIPVGAGADRWKLGAAVGAAFLLGGLLLPLVAHQSWGGGALSRLGVELGYGHGWIDVGGAAGLHVLGGLSALCLAWTLGPRRGKFGAHHTPNAIPGHNAVYVLFGALLSLVGWISLNLLGAVIQGGAGAGELLLAAINTLLAAAAAALSTAAVTRLRFGKPDASLCANGWLGGLVAISAGCLFFAPAVAVLVGAAAGVLVPMGVEWLELRWGVDDPTGAIAVHGLAGIWGLLAVGLLATGGGDGWNGVAGPVRGWLAGDAGQGRAQVLGVAFLLGVMLPLVYGGHLLLNRLRPYRVSLDAERQGLDLHELGANAFPEFVAHTDEFTLH